MKRTGFALPVLALGLILSAVAAGGWVGSAGGTDCIPGTLVDVTVSPCASVSLSPWQVDLLQPGQPVQSQTLPPQGGTASFTIVQPTAGQAITFRCRRSNDATWEDFTAFVHICPSPMLADPWEFDDGSLLGGGGCHSYVSGSHAVTLRR